MTKRNPHRRSDTVTPARPQMPTSVAEEMFPHDEDFLEDYERGSASVQIVGGRVVRRGGFRLSLFGDD